jgi:hypothetical protein
MELPTSYVLIVAPGTAAAPALVERVRRRALRTPCEFTLLARAEDVARALPALEEAAGRPVRVIDGGAEPVAALRRAVADEHFDEVLVAAPPHAARLEQDLPARVDRPWLPVAVV